MHSYPSLRRLFAVLGTVAVFAAVLPVVAMFHKADDQALVPAKPNPKAPWPLYGGTVQRNLVNTFDRNVPTEWSVAEGEHKNIKWFAELGSKAYGGPVVADGKVFIGTNNKKPRDPKTQGDKGILMCFDEATGKFLWQAVHDKLPAGRVNDWPEEGICSSPVVEEKKLYYVSNRCEVVCADTEGDQATQKAKFHWKYDMIGKLNVFPHNLATCSPLIVGDHLFVITANGVDEGHINIPQPKAPSFIVLNKNTGDLVWQDNSPSVNLVAAQGQNQEVNIGKLKDSGQILMHGQWSNPVYAVANGKKQIIFPGGDGWIRSYEPGTGKLLWKFDCNPKDSFYVLGPKATRNDFVSTPVVYENRLYIGVGQDPEHKEGIGHLWCIDMNKEGDVSPELVEDVNVFPPKTKKNPNSAAVWHYGGKSTDENAERPYVFGRTLSTCAIHDGLLYVGELAGYVHCLDARTGKKQWEHEMGANTWSSPYWVDGKVYFGNDDGKVIIFQHGKEKKILAEVDVEGKVRATPVVANGVLYVMTENKLFAIKK